MPSKTVWLRMLVTLSLLFLGVPEAVSGVILYFSPAGRGSGPTLGEFSRRHLMTLIHSYLGFILIGLALLHVTLNRRALLAYLRRISGR